MNREKIEELSDAELKNVSGGGCSGDEQAAGPVMVTGSALNYYCPQCHHDCWYYLSQVERDRARIMYYYECAVCRKAAQMKPGLAAPQISVSSGEGENAQKVTITL